MPTDLLDQYRAALPLLERIPSEMLSLGSADKNLPVVGSQAEREQAALPYVQTPSTAFSYAGTDLLAARNSL